MGFCFLFTFTKLDLYEVSSLKRLFLQKSLLRRTQKTKGQGVGYFVVVKSSYKSNARKNKVIIYLQPIEKYVNDLPHLICEPLSAYMRF